MSYEASSNYDAFRECLSACIIDRSRTEPGKASKKRVSKKRDTSTESVNYASNMESATSGNRLGNPTELADFVEFLAYEMFSTLPVELQTLSYSLTQHNQSLSDTYLEPLSPSTLDRLVDSVSPTVVDTLSTYCLIDPPKTDVQSLMSPVITAYVSAVTLAPPPWISTRTSACEICERDWIPLTYHHLIPKGVHAKVVKRGWHDEHSLNSVAWLCRACHSFVHRMASNEVLAREWYTVEKICEREDVRKWAQWAGGVRWKKR